MKNFIFLGAALILFSGCASQNLSKQDCDTKEAMPACSVSADVAGVYEASILCADCKVAVSTLELFKNGNFMLETVIHKKSSQRTLENGTYTIKGTEVTLVNQYKEKTVYKFDGRNLTKLENKDSFIKEVFGQNLIYKPLK